MLDVHPPEHTPHSWRDFFIHIATIVVGLLIAVALEQSVEFVHHRRERTELREALVHEAEKARGDTEVVQAFADSRVQWLDVNIAAAQQALDNQQTLHFQESKSMLNFEAPDDPVWSAAKSSGLAELLTQGEIEAFSELQGSFEYAERYHLPMNDSVMAVRNFNQRFLRAGSTTPDFASADKDDRKEYLRLLITARSQVLAYERWCRSLHGAAVAVAQGERNLRKIQTAEGQSW